MLSTTKLSSVIILIVLLHLSVTVISKGIRLDHVGVRLLSQSSNIDIHVKNITNSAGRVKFGGTLNMKVAPQSRNIVVKIIPYFDRQGKLVPTPIKLTQNICDALDKNILKIRTILAASNLTECPYKKGLYSISSWIPEDSELPNLPVGRYQADLIFAVDNVEWSKFRWIGGIVKA